MPSTRIVVIGASAGGVEALLTVARTLPREFPAAVFAVLHLPPHSNSVLPQLLRRAGVLPAEHARHGEPIVGGRWYVAPPDHHLLVRGDQVHLGRGPSENGHRPAVDPLFRSAASAYDSQVVGVVLTGSLDDGTGGLLAIKLAGGVAVVQDPEEAMYPSMPQSALANVAVDYVRPVAEIGNLLFDLVSQPAGTRKAARAMSVESKEMANEAAEAEEFASEDVDRRGVPSAFACPDCHGVLWEVKEGDLVRYRCRVGHAYLPQALSSAQSDQLEESLWIALRTLRESSALSKRLAERARERNMGQMAVNYEARAREASQRAAVIEDVLRRGRINASTEEANAAEAGQVTENAGGREA
jgi:two-component system, chemotaxis family, protein-glutamate methylesterase/glutaminase